MHVVDKQFQNKYNILLTDSVFSLSVDYPYFFKGRNNLKLILLLLANLWGSPEFPEREHENEDGI